MARGVHRWHYAAHELNALYQAHPHWVIGTLFACTAQTLGELAANPRWLGGPAAFTLVLHSWTQDLRRHLHLHALIACGPAWGQWAVGTAPTQARLPVPGACAVKGVSRQVHGRAASGA